MLALACLCAIPDQARAQGSVAGDRAALEALYRATDGENWFRNTNWLTDASLSEWHGVDTDANGRVEALSLGSNRLSGPIPAELGDLANLEDLSLSRNALSGPIPAELGELANLEDLDLSSNDLSGPIPAELGELANLEDLALWGNALSGPIPAELGELANLEDLILGSNALSGPIPAELGELANLEFLALWGNALSGPIPAELGELANLERLNLRSNDLSGPIPAELGELANLVSLALWGNALSGPIPAELGELANLVTLSLSSNDLRGPIPAELGELANLVTLSLSSNDLRGPIPAELGDLANLEDLDLEFNNLSGSLPRSLMNLTLLYGLYFADNASLCAPPDAAFQAWLSGISDVTGYNCTVPDVDRNSRETAAPLGLGKALGGAISPAGDIDYYRLDIEEPTETRLLTTGNLDTVGELYDASETRLASNDDGGNNSNFRIAYDLEPGVYYLAVRGYSNRVGSYVVEAFAAPADAGDNRETAAPLRLGKPQSGEIAPAGDIDYYRLDIEAPTEARLLTTGNLDTVGELYDAAGTRLAFDDDGADFSNFRIAYDLEPGVYYLAVSGFSSDVGSYVVEAFAAPADAGGSRETAAPLRLGEPQSGEISPAGDIDYYRLDIEAPTEARLLTTGNLDTVGELYDAAGTRLAFDDDGVDYSNFRIVYNLWPGVYYLAVRGYSNDVGPYVIEAYSGYGRIARDTAVPLLLAEPQSGEISGENDIDYYRLEVHSLTEVRLFTSGDLDTEGSLYDASGAFLVFDDDGGDGRNFRIVRDLEPGVYYLAVTGWQNDRGPYAIEAAAPGPVSIPDEALRSVLEGALEKAAGEAILHADLRALTSLSVRGPAISSLLGLGWAVNLRSLSLRSHAISDLGPLSGLTALEELDIAGNAVSDLSPLSGLSALKQLDLDDNQVSDLSPLSGLTGLVELSLSRNEVADLSPLGSMRSLRVLNAAGNAVANLSPLSGLTGLRHLDLEVNRIVDIAPLAALPLLEALFLGGNLIMDDSTLPGLGALRTLSLWRNPVLEQPGGGSVSSLRGRGVEVVVDGRELPMLAHAAAVEGEGSLRLINLGEARADVWVYGIDDSGQEHGPVGAVLPANGAAEFDSTDFEQGNRALGLNRGTGAGVGDWRLAVYSSKAEVAAFAYLESQPVGFAANVSAAAPLNAAGAHRVGIFNPADEAGPISRLRVLNDGDAAAAAVITGIDDAGASAGPVTVSLPARSAVELTAAQLEAGSAPGLTGQLGDGQGKWRLTVTSDADIRVMNLLTAPSGYLTNLSTAPAAGAAHWTPLLPAVSHATREGFVRVVNRTGEAGMVSILGYDDSGNAHGPVSLSIGARQAVHLTSADWENGNASKGLPTGVGAGQGPWKLRFTSELDDMEVLSYIRAGDGFLTAMHDLAPRSCDTRVFPGSSLIGLLCISGELLGSHLYAIPLLLPADNDSGYESLLRLTNFGDGEATVQIIGLDDRGDLPGGSVTVSVAPKASRSLSATELESGEATGSTGAIGDGAGSWELLLWSDEPIGAMSLIEGPAGHLINLTSRHQQ